MTEDITNLERQGYDSSILTQERLIEIFNELDHGKIAKESVTLLYQKLMNYEIKNLNEFESGIETMTEHQLEEEINGILCKHLDTIREKGMNSMGMLMGRTMAVLRGRIRWPKDKCNSEAEIRTNRGFGEAMSFIANCV